MKSIFVVIVGYATAMLQLCYSYATAMLQLCYSYATAMLIKKCLL